VSEPLIAKPQENSKVLTGAGPFDSLEDVARDVALPFQEGKKLDPRRWASTPRPLCWTWPA
jgi:hypothetical protein